VIKVNDECGCDDEEIEHVYALDNCLRECVCAHNFQITSVAKRFKFFLSLSRSTIFSITSRSDCLARLRSRACVCVFKRRKKKVVLALLSLPANINIILIYFILSLSTVVF
jgi:hypothetical protein